MYESQTAVLSELASLSQRASELFGDASLLALKANALGATTNGFASEAFVGTLSELTPIDAAGVLALLQGIQSLINSSVDINGQSVVLGTSILKFGLAHR